MNSPADFKRYASYLYELDGAGVCVYIDISARKKENIRNDDHTVKN